ncbi:MAG: hypothetical protein ABL962_13840, partial [Fimbriimonadaceae bacterium]
MDNLAGKVNELTAWRSVDKGVLRVTNFRPRGRTAKCLPDKVYYFRGKQNVAEFAFLLRADTEKTKSPIGVVNVQVEEWSDRCTEDMGLEVGAAIARACEVIARRTATSYHNVRAETHDKHKVLLLAADQALFTITDLSEAEDCTKLIGYLNLLRRIHRTDRRHAESIELCIKMSDTAAKPWYTVCLRVKGAHREPTEDVSVELAGRAALTQEPENSKADPERDLSLVDEDYIQMVKAAGEVDVSKQFSANRPTLLSGSVTPLGFKEFAPKQLTAHINGDNRELLFRFTDDVRHDADEPDPEALIGYVKFTWVDHESYGKREVRELQLAANDLERTLRAQREARGLSIHRKTAQASGRVLAHDYSRLIHNIVEESLLNELDVGHMRVWLESLSLMFFLQCQDTTTEFQGRMPTRLGDCFKDNPILWKFGLAAPRSFVVEPIPNENLYFAGPWDGSGSAALGVIMLNIVSNHDKVDAKGGTLGHEHKLIIETQSRDGVILIKFQCQTKLKDTDQYVSLKRPPEANDKLFSDWETARRLSGPASAYGRGLTFMRSNAAWLYGCSVEDVDELGVLTLTSKSELNDGSPLAFTLKVRDVKPVVFHGAPESELTSANYLCCSEAQFLTLFEQYGFNLPWRRLQTTTPADASQALEMWVGQQTSKCLVLGDAAGTNDQIGTTFINKAQPKAAIQSALKNVSAIAFHDPSDVRAPGEPGLTDVLPSQMVYLLPSSGLRHPSFDAHDKALAIELHALERAPLALADAAVHAGDPAGGVHQ